MHARRLPLLAALLGLILLGSAPARAESFKLDPVHSSLIFRIKHLGVGYIYGRFNDFSGSFAFDKDPARCALSAEIKVASIDSNNATRDKHLRSADFFNVKEFPKITFKSTRVRVLDARTYEVTGNLTLHGVTKSVTARLERIGTGKDPFTKGVRTGFETTFTLKRSDFGMKFMTGAIGDEVRITLAAEGVAAP
jgi:polyisoprenoid-binding protein YceI